MEDDSDSGSSSSSESDEDALFCSAPKEAASANVIVSSPRRPGTACSKHREKRERCPVDCPNAPQLTSTPSINVSKKPKQPDGSHPTTGGKTLNPEAIAAYLESMRELRDSEDETDVDSEVGEPVREKRQQSPITDRDIYHWCYRVERKTWSQRTEEEATEWTICGKTGYSSLQEANAVADKESIRQRHGQSLQPYSREWSRKLDGDDMVHIYVDNTNNIKRPAFFKVRVVRQLRTYSNGVRPETKFGWIEKTAYEIRKTTTTTIIIPSPPRKEDGEHSEEEEPSEPEPQVETTEELEILGNDVFTNVDEANRKAANFAVDCAVSRPETKNLDEIVAYQKQRAENLEGLIEGCDQLEAEGKFGVFEAEYQLNDAIVIKIEVVGRPLVGPRNI